MPSVRSEEDDNKTNQQENIAGVSSSEKNTTTKTKEGGRVTGKDLGETGGGTLGWPIREDWPERQLKKERSPLGETWSESITA